MRIVIILLLVACCKLPAQAQTKTSSKNLQHAKAYMSPKQIQLLEQYQSSQESAIPTRNEKLLASIPTQVLSKPALISYVQQMEVKLKNTSPKELLSYVEQTIIGRKGRIDLIAQDALANWYGSSPGSGLLLCMHVVQQQPDEPLYWNNLASMLNIARYQHRAVPILRYLDQQHPGSALVKNNLGQAYLGLGDVQNAERYLKAALSIDSTNAEANHSMGMMMTARGKQEQAQQCFVEALKSAYVPSTVTQLEETGYNIEESDALYEAYKKELPANIKAPVLGSVVQLKLPQKPLQVKKVALAREEIKAFQDKMIAEGTYWGSRSSKQTSSEKQQAIHGTTSLYSDKVQRILLPGLYRKDFPSEFMVPPDVDIAADEMKWKEYYRKRKEIQDECSEEINALLRDRNHTNEQWMALSAQHCRRLMSFDNSFLSQENGIKQEVAEKYKRRWDAYLTEVLKICSLDPFGFRSHAEGAISQYYATMVGMNGNVLYLEPCEEAMSEEAADSILLSRELQLECPAGKINISLGVGSISHDCSKIKIEGELGPLLASWEKEFATGKSTLAVGPGVSITGGGLEAGAKAVVYITFDKNQQPVDFGYKAEAGIKAPFMKSDIKIEGQGGIVSGFSGAAIGFGSSVNL